MRLTWPKPHRIAASVTALIAGVILFGSDMGSSAWAIGPGLSTAPKSAQSSIAKAQFFWPFRSERRVRRAPPRAKRRQPLRRATPAVPKGQDGKLSGKKKVDENATRIVVFGDSVAKDLWGGMVGSIGKESSFEVLRKTKVSSGIVREDFYNWREAVKATFDDGRIDVAVWMIGINDLQQLRNAGGRFEPNTPEWSKAYKARIDAIVKTMQEKGTAVYWVGLPIVRSNRLSKGYAQINDLVRSRIESMGARFIDIWDGFADEAGAYSAYGPDLAGARRKMRRGNGIHFSKRGNEKLVHFVEKAIMADLASGGRTLDGRRVIRQGERGGLVVSSGNSAAKPGELAGAGDPASGLQSLSSLGVPNQIATNAGPGRPLMLNSAKTAPAKIDGEEVISPLFMVLMRGEALPPKSGRADDFAWNGGAGR